MKCFLVRAVFCIETRFRPGRRRQRLYERRIVRVDASSPDVAQRKAARLCRKDEWVARSPVSDIAVQTQRFLGIGSVLDAADIMEPETIWFEYLDEEGAASELRSIQTRGLTRQKRRAP